MSGRKHIVGLCVCFLLISAQRMFAADFHSISDAYHVSIRETNSVVKDDDGFVWVSSKLGIMRLTDDDCRIYHPPYSKVDMVTVKLAFGHGKLLAFSSSSQIFAYNPATDQFEPIANIATEFNQEATTVGKILIDSRENAWIATSIGLCKLDETGIRNIDDKEQIDCIEWIDDSTMFVARRNSMYTLNINTLQRGCDIANINVNAIKSSLYYDGERRLMWIGTKASGLFLYNFDTDHTDAVSSSRMPRQPILALEPLNDSTMLVGYDGQGVWCIDTRTLQVTNVFKSDINNPNSLPDNGVYDIMCEPDNRVWVCTYSAGAAFFSIEQPSIKFIAHKTNDINSLSDNNVNDIIEDSRGNIWFATNNGINRYVPSADRWLRVMADGQNQSQVFLSVCEDARGNIWAGTYSSGIYTLNSDGRVLSHRWSRDGKGQYSNDFVFDIMLDSRKNIWIGGTNNDVFCHNLQTGDYDNYGYVPLNTFAELDSARMLFGCTNGLIMADKATGDRTVLINRVIINDILVTDSAIWVATGGNGLLMFDRKNNRTVQFDKRHGLPSDFVTSIMSEGGSLWIGTEFGLCKSNLEVGGVSDYATKFGDNQLPDGNLQHSFVLVDGLAATSFNRASHCKLRDGTIIWGTNRGAVSINPSTQFGRQPSGRIFLQDITVAGRSIRNIEAGGRIIDHIDSLQLKHTQNTVRIELVPISKMALPNFSWWLEGLDDGWNQPTASRIISYSNLPDRQFKLHIRLYDNSLSHVIDERLLFIGVTPPLWHRLWFIVVCYLIVGLGVYMLISQYIQSIKRQHAEDKIRFFTQTAHDIRTSLTLVKAPIEELAKEKRLTAEGRRNLELASSQTQQLAMVVTQLMDFQKTDTGKEKTHLVMTELVSFVSNRAQMFESVAAGSGIRLEYECDNDKYVTAIDQNMIGKVIDNLLSNAIKYSQGGGVVNISLKCDEKAWRLIVTDHGIGISRQAQKRLFTEFYRSENAVNANVIGSGIGLMLVKKYVELHGGNVGCTSQEGVGAVFTINVPRETSGREVSGELTGKKTIGVVRKPEHTEDIGKSDYKLLIVEDNTNLLNFMKDTLSPDFDVLTAANGAIAWKIVSAQLPDIVVSDIMMPEMDGFELCRHIKSTFETAHIPIILLTALSEQTDQLKGLKLDADDYLTKPFDMEVLRQRLMATLHNRQLVKSKLLNSLSHGMPVVELGNKQNDDFLQKLYDVVKRNMSNNEFDKEQFASEMNVSQSLLYKKVKALTDTSPTDFIKIVRLEYAQQLLKTQRYNITEISEMCGFASAAYFSTVYKKQYGVPPSDFLQNSQV